MKSRSNVRKARYVRREVHTPGWARIEVRRPASWQILLRRLLAIAIAIAITVAIAIAIASNRVTVPLLPID